MPAAADIKGTAYKDGSVILLSRVVGADGVAIEQADVSTITYTIELLSETDEDEATAVAGHTNQAVTISAVIFDALQTGGLWTADSTGYNFRHAIPIDSYNAFDVAGRHYRVTYTITPTSGQPILVRYKLRCI